MAYHVVTASSLPPTLASRFGNELTANFDFYAKYSSAQTELYWAVVEDDGELIAAAPVVRLARRPATEMLRSEVRRWLGWLGPFSRKTTLLVDTAFLAYDDRSPFLCDADDALRSVVF